MLCVAVATTTDNFVGQGTYQNIGMRGAELRCINIYTQCAIYMYMCLCDCPLDLS